eukprot:TRINITY_DN82116_c0_g1_i1.p1 TRINITY_DN82116_c0_g1~~TRINITY_DN82116_c0_g1_i1.p1  ORF type:complete len:278 (+),score=35.00 TRINITY_DN82116_c0_g1_i1:69-836(+)
MDSRSEPEGEPGRGGAAASKAQSSNPPDWGDHALPFLAVGRVQDRTILAHLEVTREQEADTKGVFSKLMEAAKKKMKPGQRTRLQWGPGSVNCILDRSGELLYCVVTSSMDYPDRQAYQLLADLEVAVKHALDNGTNLDALPSDALQEALQGTMRQLVQRNQEKDPQLMGPVVSYASPEVTASGHAREFSPADNSRKWQIYVMLGAVIVLLIFFLSRLFRSGTDPEADSTVVFTRAASAGSVTGGEGSSGDYVFS